MANRNHHGIAICYTAIFLISLNGLFAQSIALDAVSITQLRSVIAAIAIAAFCLLIKRDLKLQTQKDMLTVYIVGMIMGAHWATLFHSMQVSSVAVGMLSLYTFPVLTVLLEPFFNHRRLKKVDLLAAMIVTVGIAIMAYGGLDESNKGVILGVFWGVLSALLFSIRNLVQKYHLTHVGSESSMLHQMIMIAVMFAFWLDYAELVVLPNQDILLLVLLGLVPTAGGHTLLVVALKRLSAKTVAMIGCVQPVFAACLAWLILQEQLTYYTVAGGVTVLAVALYESVKMNRNTA